MQVLDVIKGFGIELSEEQQSAVMKAVGDGYVLRSDYNSLKTSYKKLKGEKEQLEQRDFSAIEADRDKYKKDYEGLLKEKNDGIKKSKLFEALGDCKDKDYVLYKLGGVDSVEFDDKNELKDTEALINKAKELAPDYFGKVPFVVSKTSGPNEDVANKKEQANTALRSLFGKE